jgi:hypothetical protein
MSLPFTHVVKIDGEAIRKFRSKKEALWFAENKNDATIEKLPIEEVIKDRFNLNEFTKLHGEPLF